MGGACFPVRRETPIAATLISLSALSFTPSPQSMADAAAALRLDILIKLLLAALCGGAIGLEREMARKPAGLRTNILICVGAMLFTHLSISIALLNISPDGHPYGDNTRIAAQIVSGIGFLGAGAIFHAQGAVVGLTTAATIWVVAAVGMAIGSGAYVEALGSTAAIMLVLVGLRPAERYLQLKRRRVHATVRVKSGVSFDVVRQVVSENGVHIKDNRTFEHDSDRSFELELIGASRQFDIVCDALRRMPDVISIVTE